MRRNVGSVGPVPPRRVAGLALTLLWIERSPVDDHVKTNWAGRRTAAQE